LEDSGGAANIFNSLFLQYYTEKKTLVTFHTGGNKWISITESIGFEISETKVGGGQP